LCSFVVSNQISQRRVLSPCVRSLSPIRFLKDESCLPVFVPCLQSDFLETSLVSWCSFVVSNQITNRRLLPLCSRSFLSRLRLLIDESCLLVFVRCLQSDFSKTSLVSLCSFVVSNQISNRRFVYHCVRSLFQSISDL